MGWIFAVTISVYVLVNLPLAYSLIYVHRPRGISALWGYAPNQFLFLVLVFPFATLYTLLALRILIGDIRPKIPVTDPARAILENWSAWLVLGLALVSVIAVVVYFTSPMSLDKLRKPYADRALQAMARVDRRIEQLPSGEQAAARKAVIKKAREKAEQLDAPPITEEKAFQVWLEDLAEHEPEVFLHIVQNPSFQLRLNLLEPTIHSLNVLQLVLALWVGLATLLCTWLSVHTAGAINLPVSQIPGLQNALNATRLALFFFALYPLFYNQQRLQMQEYVEVPGTSLQHIVTALVVVALLFWLNTTESGTRLWTMQTLWRYLPIAILGSGLFAELLSPDSMRQLIGKDSKMGWQVILVLVFSLLAFLPSVPFIWPRR